MAEEDTKEYMLQSEMGDKAMNKFFQTTGYMKDVPRFTVQGMNQAEFIFHVFRAAYNRGWRDAVLVSIEKGDQG